MQGGFERHTADLRRVISISHDPEINRHFRFIQRISILSSEFLRRFLPLRTTLHYAAPRPRALTALQMDSIEPNGAASHRTRSHPPCPGTRGAGTAQVLADTLHLSPCLLLFSLPVRRGLLRRHRRPKTQYALDTGGSEQRYVLSKKIEAGHVSFDNVYIL